MTNIFDSDYWQSEFTVTEADLNRLENYISETGQAHDLTTLASRITRGRLLYGVDLSRIAAGVRPGPAGRSVSLWDPAGQWQIGDHTIVARPVSAGTYKAFVGEIVGTGPKCVEIQLDGVARPKKFMRASPGSENARHWRDKVQSVVEAQAQSQELEEKVAGIMLQHGSSIASQLLDALRADERFVRLAGCWFLRPLSAFPSEEQLATLAWAMLDLEEPQPTDVLLTLLPPPVAAGDPGLFGLYLALREHPRLFTNADPGQRPRWQLAGPPPGPTTARYAAYDPDSYQVLCEPGDAVGIEVAQRLWELGLFHAVCALAG